MAEKSIKELQEKIKKLKELNPEQDKDKIIGLLQEINNSFLKNYKFTIDGLEFIPIETEIYYHKGPADQKGIDNMIYKHALQKKHYGQLFFHRKSKKDDIDISSGGLDICLSDSDEYYLSILIRTAEIKINEKTEKISGINEETEKVSGINKIQQLFYRKEIEKINNKLKALENAKIKFEESFYSGEIVTQPRIKGKKYEKNEETGKDGEELNSIKLEYLDDIDHPFYTQTIKETLKGKRKEK